MFISYFHSFQVGGSMYDTTLKHMNRFGRISLCGCISLYNEKLDDIENKTNLSKDDPSLGYGMGNFYFFCFPYL